MKYVLLVSVLLVSSFCVQAQGGRSFTFKTGDFIFQDLECGDLCNAIEAVTPALGSKHFSHIGLVYYVHDTGYVIEAIGKNVHLTPIDSFLFRQLSSNGQPKIVVGRLKKQFQVLNKRAVKFALKQKGVLYDDVFIYNNGKYYCSELIYDAYKAANNGQPFFTLSPMTFKDSATGNTYPAWVNYYQKLGKNIPEGKPGCSPGSIAISNKIDIIAFFY